MAPVKHAEVNEVMEWSFTSRKSYGNAFAEVEAEAVFTGPGGREWRVPAFWAGGKKWRVRFAAPRAGEYRFRTACSDPSNAGLHGAQGEFRVQPYAGGNPLLVHGRVRVAGDRRHFEHADGTPFFWLGDTWWMGLCNRIRFKKELAALAADRLRKGFSVIQIVAGLYPDMDWHDLRGANEAGFPYNKDFSQFNPSYYDRADRRIRFLVDSGLTPCIVGCWGYFLMWMGPEKMKRHWRNLIARWGAYPVIWCAAGEATMPYYDLMLGPKADKQKADQSRTDQRAGWTEVCRYIRATDPFRNLVGIHPTDVGRDQVTDGAVLDYDMLQTGHGGYDSLPNTLTQVRKERARKPPMPVVLGEANYEGILGCSKEDVQRLTFWTCLLNGVGGYTYGANGIWQLNRPDQPYGPSPHGSSWGDRSWQEAAGLPGSASVGLGRRILEKYPWWRLEPHPEWIEPNSRDDCKQPHAAGVPGQLRIVYFFQAKAAWTPAEWGTVKGLEPGVAYRATWIDPESGREFPIGQVAGDAKGNWRTPQSPIIGSMLLVMEKQ